MAFNILAALFGTKKERDVKKLLPLLHKVNAQEAWALTLKDEEFPSQSALLRERIKAGESLEDLLPEAFALSREAARRVLGERPFDVQILGGIVLHQGKIVEMKTGEGKTLSSVGAAYLNALSGNGVHIVTVNDYLAERDSQWMGRVYRFLGLSVGVILTSMDNSKRRAEYECDITYGTNNEFGFDYLRDNMSATPEGKVQRLHNYCVVDEIDSILVDEARTPLIISGAAEDDTYKVNEISRLATSLVEVEKKEGTEEYPNEDLGEQLVGDYKIDEKGKRISFTSQGMDKVEKLLQKRNLIKGSIFEEYNFEYVHYFIQAVKAQKLFEKDVDYVVNDGEVQIVDEFTGRILHGRRYSEGLHEAIEAKERIKIARRNRTLATITFQNYFRMYKKISGMTGTADTEAPEFAKIYNLDVVVVPTNRTVRRDDENDLVFLDESEKFDAICEDIREAHKKGQPILVGTVSIEKSEKLSSMLTRKGLAHEVLNAKNHAREATIIAEAGSKGAITIATNMAGRGTDIKLGGNLEFRARKRAGSAADEAEYRTALDREYPTWLENHNEVCAAGGLYVIGTERHESRRIDNQLRGRSGRQGDPGRSQFFISLDDDLMRLFGGDNLKRMMGRIGMKKGESIYHPLLNRTIEGAQKKVEERNFEIRKHLLEYDDVLSEQRKFIYGQRDAILSDDNLQARILATGHEMVDIFLEAFQDDVKSDLQTAFAGLQSMLRENFNVTLPYRFDSELIKDTARMKADVLALLEADLKEKTEIAGAENLNQFIRMQYLQSIDSRWLGHLENMEALREAVYLRSYAQKNPLVEYKLEGFSIFSQMVEDIKKTIATRIFMIRIQNAEPRQAVPATATAISASHAEAHQFASGAMAGPDRSGQQQEAQEASAVRDASERGGGTVVRAGSKVGRNDPCPCGSGKKYKHCHGR